MANSTRVTRFLLAGSPEGRELRFLYSLSFLLLYLGALLGNLLIVTITTMDRSLHSPMYFFLRNLSVLDMCYISATVPNACVNSLTDNRAISAAGCATQIFLVIYCAYVEVLFLTSMAWDRYVAICQPLHYAVIMSPRVCVQATLAALLSGFIYAGVHTGSTFRLSFCRSRVVRQFFCDIPSLLQLSCTDTFSNSLLILVSIVLVGGSCFALIVLSYVRIFSAVLQCPARERRKAFSTCIPHLLVVSVFLGSSSCMYLKSPGASEMTQDALLSVFYTIVPPFLNPVVYSLRNQQIKGAIKKIVLGKFYSRML
ncbi:olfactory receptor 14C36-like [Ochotona princeps]|uniref:olfactory receptor 14C36-like n=1 Tax=Ochotona princeps TaxID=9978 RepID=UPI0027148A50|nr:olfactory receptor 14C36-like [Ochotona princeps]